jgi:serine/threonine protein kinase
MEREEPLPARIDRYEPLKKLATGGMAEIFLAKQSGLEGFEKVVVLKRILTHLATDDEFVSMFLDEARIAAKLSHPNIVQIYDLGKADDTFYIAMEYVSGRNIQHLITKQQAAGGHLPVEHVCRIIGGVCDGLFYAHSRKDYDGKPLNIIHRDISPQNILISFAGGVKVVDFGIAKASTQLAQTRAGVLKGKYAYMSPEQVRGSKIDHRSDIFAVGLVMYEMLTGVRAFERDSSLKTLKAIVQDKPLNPREMNPEIPMEVVKILSKALEKNPDRRYKTAQEFQLAIEDWLEQSPKKSNNVRLSRFLYDLFDDELNSAEGTMVVKGVGQVVIPTSRGEKLKPAVEEEVDSKTLTAALVDAPERPDAVTAPVQTKQAMGRIRDELANQPMTRPPIANETASMKQPARSPAGAAAKPGARGVDAALKAATPAPEVDDDDDGRTVPGYDMEQLERDRAAHEAAKAARQAHKPPPRGALADEFVDEPEEKTRAGVTATSEASAEASIELAAPVEPDAHARAMLQKVESIARGPQASPARGGRPGGAVNGGGGGGEPAPPPQWEPPTHELARGSITAEADDDPSAPGARAKPGPAPFVNDLADELVGELDGDDDGALEDAPTIRPSDRPVMAPSVPPSGPSSVPGYVPSFVPSPAARAASPAAERPMAWYAVAAASAVMGIFSVALFAAGALAFPAAPPAVEFGVVVVHATPEGASIVVDGVATPAPGQLAIPLDGAEHVVDVVLAGHETKHEKVVFAPGTNVATLNVTFE